MKFNKTAALLVIIVILASIVGYMAYLNYQEEIKKTYWYQNHLVHFTLARALSISTGLWPAPLFYENLSSV